MTWCGQLFTLNWLWVIRVQPLVWFSQFFFHNLLSGQQNISHSGYVHVSTSSSSSLFFFCVSLLVSSLPKLSPSSSVLPPLFWNLEINDWQDKVIPYATLPSLFVIYFYNHFHFSMRPGCDHALLRHDYILQSTGSLLIPQFVMKQEFLW